MGSARGRQGRRPRELRPLLPARAPGHLFQSQLHFQAGSLRDADHHGLRRRRGTAGEFRVRADAAAGCARGTDAVAGRGTQRRPVVRSELQQPEQSADPHGMVSRVPARNGDVGRLQPRAWA